MSGYSVFYSYLAKQDILESVNYYNSLQPGLSDRFVMDVLDMVERIVQQPLSGTIRYRNIRSRLLKRFPCMIHYSILEVGQRIIIDSVYNTRRQDFWNS